LLYSLINASCRAIRAVVYIDLALLHHCSNVFQETRRIVSYFTTILHSNDNIILFSLIRYSVTHIPKKAGSEAKHAYFERVRIILTNGRVIDTASSWKSSSSCGPRTAQKISATSPPRSTSSSDVLTTSSASDGTRS
jgi:hypothetical protein